MPFADVRGTCEPVYRMGTQDERVVHPPGNDREDDDLLSEYGKAKWRRCMRSKAACVFFAGPCTGGSPWNRLNTLVGEATEHVIRMKATLFWKLWDEFLKCLVVVINMDGMALMEFFRGCDY